MISERQRRGNVMRRAICNSNVEFASLCVYMSRRKFETLFFKFKSVVQHHLNIILNTRKRRRESDMANRLLIRDTFVEIVRIFSKSSKDRGRTQLSVKFLDFV